MESEPRGRPGRDARNDRPSWKTFDFCKLPLAFVAGMLAMAALMTSTYGPSDTLILQHSGTFGYPTTMFTPAVAAAARSRRKIFFDIGSNRGDVLRTFFEKKEPADSNTGGWRFGEVNYNASDFIVYGFEANPEHWLMLVKLVARYSEMAYIVPLAVWDRSFQSFQLSIDNDSNGNRHGHWGASLLHKWGNTSVNTMTIDFASFVSQLTTESDLVYMKFNIEGAEYNVLKSLKERGLLCRIRVGWFYFHPRFTGSSGPVVSHNEVKAWLEDCKTEIRLFRVH